MDGDPLAQRAPSAAEAVSAEERLLRALFAVLPDAMAEPEFGIALAHYLRRRVQRLHPPGKQDLRSVRSRAGLRFTIDLGDRFASEIYYGQFAEPFELDLLAGLIEPGSIVVDVGANFGLYAVTCGRHVDPARGGRVIAFEPAPSIVGTLRKNIDRNGLTDRVHVLEACAGEADGETSFNVAAESSLSGIAATGRSPVADVITVPVRALPSVLNERDLDRIDLLKIDAEGHEHAVLRGALPLLEAGDPIAMVEVSAKNMDASARTALVGVLKDVFGLGYSGRWFDAAAGIFRPVDSPDAMAGLSSANVFLSRRNSAAERRLLAAAKDVWSTGDAAPAFTPEPSPIASAEFPAGVLAGFERDRMQMLAVHLRRERERNVDLAERIAEREWLERGMMRISGSEQRMLAEVRGLRELLESKRNDGAADADPSSGSPVDLSVAIGELRELVEAIRNAGASDADLKSDPPITSSAACDDIATSAAERDGRSRQEESRPWWQRIRGNWRTRG